jgi:hypothetical protein
MKKEMAEERLSVFTDPTSFSQEHVIRSLVVVVLPLDFQSELPAHGRVREVVLPSLRPSRTSKKKT